MVHFVGLVVLAAGNGTYMYCFVKTDWTTSPIIDFSECMEVVWKTGLTSFQFMEC
jgi:hypothetical protein